VRRALAAVALLLCGAGCATTVGNSSPSAPAGAEVFFPLSMGNAWSYDADGALVVLKVRTREGQRAQMGEFAFEVRPDGIVRDPPGKYVLQLPLQVGHEWPLPGGGRARIVATDARVPGVDRSWDGCVVVEEEGPDGTRTRTSFARGVGPVDVVVTSGTSTTHARLRGFTPAGEEI
jgi:hypothetical protein